MIYSPAWPGTRPGRGGFFLEFTADLCNRWFRHRHLIQNAVSCTHHGWSFLMGVSDSRGICRLTLWEPRARPALTPLAGRRPFAASEDARMGAFLLSAPPYRDAITFVNP